MKTKAKVKLLREITTEGKEWIIVEARGQGGVLHVTQAFHPHEIEKAEALYDELVETITKNGFGPYRTDIKVTEIEV